MAAITSESSVKAKCQTVTFSDDRKTLSLGHHCPDLTVDSKITQVTLFEKDGKKWLVVKCEGW